MDDDYAASRSNLEKLIKEIQCIKECLTCRICLEFFKEPVTIKCGHKFCKYCILKVVANDNKPKCSFCKLKIQKRSIPKDGNETLISVVKSFKTLVNAINDDLGINVLEPHNQIKHSKESALVYERPRALELEEAASSEGSTENKILKSQAENTKRLSLRKKKVIEDNNLFNCIQENSESESNQASHEKVENWLKNNSQHVDGNEEEPKYKETQLRIQEIEMLAKKKKLNESVVDKALLKVPSVPAASHSDTWSRVKRVGKEMQAKIFKSLNVSVEKSSTSIVLDDTVPYDSINNDSKNVSEEIILRNNPSDKISLSEAKQKVSTKNVSKDYICKNLSTDSSNSHKDNLSLSCVDQKQINEIIGISTAENNLHTSERAKDLCISNQKNFLSPLKVIVDVHRENEISDDDESSRSKLKISQNECTLTKTHSPERSKSRLSLRLSAKTSNYSSYETKSPRKRPLITFKKLGKICKRSKKIPFLKLGKIKPADRLHLKASGIVVKSDLTVNVNYKQLIANHENTIVSIASANIEDKILPREKNSQLKMLSIEPHQNSAEEFNSSRRSKTSEMENSYLSNLSKTSSKILKKPKMSNLLTDIEKSKEKIDCEISSYTNLSPVKVKSEEVTSKKEEFNSSRHSTSEIENSCLSNVSKTSSKILKKPKMSNLLTDIEKFKEEMDCEISSNSSLSPVKIKPKEITSEKEEFISSRHSETSEIDNSCLSNISKTSSKILKKSKISNLLTNIEKSKEKIDCEISSNTSLSPEKIKPKEVASEQEEVVSVSSNESESDNFTPNDIKTGFQNNYSFQEKNKKISEEMQSNVDSDSSIASLNNNKKKRKEKCISSSASSSAMGSPIKRKRSHSESSESTDDVLQIIDKWCEPDRVKDQTIKKIKISSSFQKDLDKDKNRSKHSEDFVPDENDCTLVETDLKKSETLNFKIDSSTGNIINEVKSFKENKANVNLMNIPSSLMSADLFESHEHSAQLHRHLSPKQLDKSMSSHSSVSTCRVGKNIQKENLNLDQSIADVTMVDTLQFNRKKSNISESSDGSNKENKKLVENVAATKTTDHIAYESEEQNFSNVKCKITAEKSVMNVQDSCHMSDSSMDITQGEIALKKIEKELFGVDLSIAPESKLQEKYEDRFSTPRRQIKRSHIDINSENEFDPDNIGATPVTRKRQVFSFPPSKINELEEALTTPDKSTNLIPAITPMRNTKSYPVGHSTPMVDTSSVQNKSFSKSKKITLICTGLSPENIKIVQMFSKKFKATFQNNFNADVTHVIVKTDPQTKGGKKTFKYIQGVAFQKYVVDYRWVVDCLTQNTLLDEDDEKYDVLDPETLEPGAKRSRMRTQGLFEKFAFFCCEPISNILLNEFKSLLAFNGAIVANTVAELATQNDKLKIILLESESLSQNKISALKNSKQVLASFEWIVDSVSQYDILSLYAYLFNTTVEEALALGFPPELLIEEEIVEEDEEEQEEE